MIYFDGCYLAKYYVEEPDSEKIRSLVVSHPEVASSVHSRVEVAGVFHRKLREGTIPQDACQALHHQFMQDCDNGLWIWMKLDDSMVELAASKYPGYSRQIALRAADALHLACAVRNGFRDIYSNDRHIKAAAPHFGLNCITL